MVSTTKQLYERAERALARRQKVHDTNTAGASMVVKTSKSIKYEAFKDGERILPPESRHTFNSLKEVKIIKHEAMIRVRYLVELLDGTRQWRMEAVTVKRSSATDDDDDDDNEEEEYE